MDKGNKEELQLAIQELGDEEGEKPFWAKFLHPQPEADYKPIAGAIEQAFEKLETKEQKEKNEKEEKKSKEMNKIRNLDKQLAKATKLQRDLKMALMENEQKQQDTEDQ